MYTSNCATKEIPATYTSRHKESKRLFEITREMEALAFQGVAVGNDPHWTKLEAEYNSTLTNLLHLR